MKDNGINQRVKDVWQSYGVNAEPSWFEKLYKEEPIVITAVLGRMYTEEDSFESKTLPARITATKALLETKLNENLISTMEKLDESVSRLQIIGMILSVVIGLAAIGISLLLKISL